jgi:hydroxymethylglutaryl-CoA lyase
MCDEGVDEICLADSTGMGNPSQVEETMYKVKEIAQGKLIGLHLHNTENKGYANLYAGLRAGVNIVDTAFGGLGGCPFIKGATGNIATEDTIHMLEQMGVHTGIDIKEVSKISKDIEQLSGERLSGFLYKLFD